MPALAACNNQIVVAIAVHISAADPWTERAELAGQERLAREIVERLSDVDVVQPRADVLEKRLDGCRC